MSYSYNLIKADGRRKYLNATELKQFKDATQYFSAMTRTMCLMIANTGCLISEALNLYYTDVDFAKKVIRINSLRRKGKEQIRFVPLPDTLLEELRIAHENKNVQTENDKKDKLWSWSRGTAYRKIKMVMNKAEIEGFFATPLGLRHGFGVHCIENGVPIVYLKKWLGHSSLDITCMYLTVIKNSERSFAERLW